MSTAPAPRLRARPAAAAGARSRSVVMLSALAAVLALAVAPFAADRAAARRTPDAAAIAQAAEAVRGAFRAGDAVRVEPSWWLVPWQRLQGMGPGTEAWPFEALVSAEGLDVVRALDHERLFVVAGFGRDATLPPELAAAGRRREDLMVGDAVSVSVWKLERAPRLRTLSREVAALGVGRSDAAGAPLRDCTWRGDAHRCGREGWLDVRVANRVVWQREVSWLFVHPGPRGAALEVAWRDLPRASALGPSWLYVRAGPSLEAVRHPDGAEVTVAVLVDDREVDRFALRPQRFWMERRAIQLPPGAGAATVRFLVATPDNGWRETMLEADLLGTLPVALRAWATHVVE